VLTAQPDIVLVEYAANDWWCGERPPAAWAADLETILARLREHDIQPVVLSVFGPYLDESNARAEKTYGIDERGREYRKLEAVLARKYDAPYVANIQEMIVDRRCCWADANHPNEYGNRHVADSIEPALGKLLGETPRPLRKPVLHTTRDMWQEAVQLAGGRLAVVDAERRLTYAEADALVSRLAGGLQRAARTPAPKVAVFLPNCLEYYLLYWAVVRLGGVIVPLSTWLTSENLSGIFANVEPDLLIVQSDADEKPLDAARGSAVKACFALDPPASGHPPDWDDLLAGATPPPVEPLDAGAVSIVMHTSGTTGTPKGAIMRHEDLIFNVMAAINAHKFCVSDVHLLVNPMFHCTALYSSLPTAAYTKTPVVIASPRDPAFLMGLIAQERITTFLSVPSVFQQLLKVKELESYDASSLRVMAYAGSPMPVRTIRELRECFPDAALHNFFGLTETISMTHVMGAEEAEQRLDSIGRLLPNVEAQVVDEAGVPCPPGEVGELLFARENVIPGYFNNPALEEAMIEHDGRIWFRSGDLASVDEEGYFFIKGRKKDMIIVAGENVYAAEVEGILLAHEKVVEAAVKGAAATGAATFLGEEVHAYVARADESLTEQELRRHCFERLPAFKVPRKVVFLPKLPRNPSGKVVKAELE
jgi:acyl-CoA synthetase (AMP-forming)/AMP-acid ligase II